MSPSDDVIAYRRRIRPVYLAVFVLMLAVAGYGVAMMEAMFAGAGGFVWMGRGVVAGTFPPLLGFAAFLAWKPQWWAKFLLLFCGVSWSLNGVILSQPDFQQGLGDFARLAWIPITCGLSAFALAAIHFILDWRKPPPKVVRPQT
jgi:hypothetical protein